MSLMITSGDVRILLSNGNGIFAGSLAMTTVLGSEASGNTQSGFVVTSSNGTSLLNLVNSAAVNNIGSGLVAGGGTASQRIRIANVALFGNGTGMTVNANGNIESFRNNLNLGGGAPTSASSSSSQSGMLEIRYRIARTANGSTRPGLPPRGSCERRYALSARPSGGSRPRR